MQIMHFTPPQVAKYFNVNESTIKRWIQSGKLESSQTAGGHYRISKTQMNDFMQKYGNFAKSSYVLNKISSDSLFKIDDSKEYYNHLYNNDSEKAFKILNQLHLRGNDISKIFDKIVIPTLQKIGLEWEKGRLDVNIEHRISFQIAQHIYEIGSYIKESKKGKSKLAILACTPNNTHVLPMLTSDLILKKFGFKREVLGINISIEELEKALIRCGKVDLVYISNTYTSEDNKQYINNLVNLSKKYGFILSVSGAGWSPKEISVIKKYSIKEIQTLGEFEKYIKSF